MIEELKVFHGIPEGMTTAERERLEDAGLWPKDYLERLVEAAEEYDPGFKMSREIAAKYQPGGKCTCGKGRAGECDACNAPCPVCGKKMVAGQCLSWQKEDHIRA